ncbi:c-type cytochrome [Sulfurimonas sp.]|uniref:c-type cytochrome n=1 Tax=Sulfurimonas sp. TaxID=2022749 RepID=UPI0026054D4F|nr:c-type cytochrome [Sulfurimonas sp.]MCW8895578.1 c-type cytochrome [Sulfurimonas sp.]
MRKFILVLSFTTLFVGSISAQDAVAKKGQGIFESKGCAVCHKKDIDTIGPSLQTIATAYVGKETSLLSYLRGQGTPIVEPARAPVMDPQLVKIRSLFDEDMQALATYLISANDRPF